ncbi:MAG: hypothetical protein RRE78_09815 [Acidianus sp.]|jgi:hypothetical protein|nr:hypothetical protein [Acidianus sp.]
MIYAFEYVGDNFYIFWLGTKIGTITSDKLRYKGIAEIYIGEKIDNNLAPRDINELVKSWYDVFRLGRFSKYPSEWLQSIINELESDGKIRRILLKRMEKDIESEDEKKALTILGDNIVTEINNALRDSPFTKIAFTDSLHAYITKPPYVLKPYVFMNI